MTAAEELVKPDVVPAIDSDAERTAHSAATVINSALQHMGLGPDPWKGIVAGVGRLKPFTQAGSRARYRTKAPWSSSHLGGRLRALHWLLDSHGIDIANDKPVFAPESP